MMPTDTNTPNIVVALIIAVLIVAKVMGWVPADTADTVIKLVLGGGVVMLGSQQVQLSKSFRELQRSMKEPKEPKEQ